MDEDVYTVATVVDQYYYLDDESYRFHRNYKLYYRIKAVFGNNEVWSDVFYSDYTISPEVKFIYKEDSFFLRKYIDDPIQIFLKKWSGPTCSNCYDLIKERQIRQSCSNCYGTGIQGGYYGPFHSYWQRGLRPEAILLAPETKLRIVAGNAAWTLNFPPISPDDIIYCVREGLIYKANRITKPAFKGYPVRQHLEELVALPLDSPEYLLVRK